MSIERLLSELTEPKHQPGARVRMLSRYGGKVGEVIYGHRRLNEIGPVDTYLICFEDGSFQGCVKGHMLDKRFKG